ncbi:hypothetical protein PENSPDRAFT_654023 [Peniophora sp. CONT]|nr:hypothetical protein PENSPDRAFT_654023 [Peniophora sp. CONT]
MLSNHFARLLTCAAVLPLAFAAEPIEFNIGYEVWGFSPVECQGTPEQTGTLLTNQCVDISANAGKFTLEIPNETCTLSFWNQTGCEGKEGTPITLVGEQQTGCEPLVVEGPVFEAPGNPPREVAQSVKVTCPNTS